MNFSQITDLKKLVFDPRKSHCRKGTDRFANSIDATFPPVVLHSAPLLSHPIRPLFSPPRPSARFPLCPVLSHKYPIVVNLNLDPSPRSPRVRRDTIGVGGSLKARLAPGKNGSLSIPWGPFDRKSSPVSPGRERARVARNGTSPRLAAYKITEEVANHRSGRVLRGITRVFAPSVD